MDPTAYAFRDSRDPTFEAVAAHEYLDRCGVECPLDWVPSIQGVDWSGFALAAQVAVNRKRIESREGRLLNPYTYRNRPRRYENECQTCGKWFRPWKADNKFCSPECYHVEFRKRGGNRKPQLIEWQGEALPAREWAARIGISYGAWRQRIKRGWTPEKILEAARC